VRDTLYILFLKTLSLEPMHLYGIGVRLGKIRGGALRVGEGSLSPVLSRLERDGHVVSDWHISGNNRRAKYYTLTTVGRTEPIRDTHGWEMRTRRDHTLLKASRGDFMVMLTSAGSSS
jgi:DNA-binding PadR family transcriptional regulator